MPGRRDARPLAWGRVRLLVACALVCLAVTLVRSAALEEHTRRAYEVYVDNARQLFLEHITTDGSRWPADERRAMRGFGRGSSLQARDVTMALSRCLAASSTTGWAPADPERHARRGLRSLRDAEYSRIYESVVASRVLGGEGDTFRVLLRLEEHASFVTAVLDVWSTVRYVRVSGTRAYSLSDATEIREVADAGQANERLLAATEDHGYLWRANSFTRYVESDGGVYTWSS